MATRSNPSDTDDLHDAGAGHDGSGGPQQLNPLTVMARRWPLVVVGLIIGLTLAGLYHIQRQPMYESRAQVLVIKRTTNLGTRGPDARDGFIDDYVGTQLSLLKSEHILVAAAKKVNPTDLNLPLPEDPKDRASVFAYYLTVARDKDAGFGAPGGGSILQLSYKAADPVAARTILESVIKAYQQELSFIYDEATRSRIKTLDDVVRALQRERESTLARRGERSDEVRQITEEDLPSVRQRVTHQRDKELSLELEQVNLLKQLDLIAAAGEDRRKRIATLAQLTTGLKPGTLEHINLNSPEVQIRLLEAKRTERLESLGEDHPEIKALDTQLQFHRSLYEKLNPGAAIDGESVDELWAIEQRLSQQKSTIDDQLERIRSQIRADRDTLVAAGRLQDEITLLGEQALNLDRDIKDRKKELLEIEATQSSGGYQAQVLTEPKAGFRVSPILYQSVLLGFILGMVIGGGLAFASEVTDLGFQSPAEVRRRLGLPVIGHLPRLTADEVPADSVYPQVDPKLVVLHRPKSVEAEAYRGVRTQLYFNTQDKRNVIIQVTSPNPGDGKSTLTANVACSIAQSGKKVLLVDCDFRRPRVHKVFGLDKPDSGMASLVSGEARLDDAILPTGIPNLDVLPCGPRPASPAELLTSPAFAEVLNDLRERYDFVFLDTPPVLAVSDPSVVAPQVDGVVLVLRMSNKARPPAERAREQLAAVGANVIGVCINGVGRNSEGYGSYGYGYSYQYRYQYSYDYEYAEAYADEDEDEDTPAGDAPARSGQR